MRQSVDFIKIRLFGVIEIYARGRVAVALAVVTFVIVVFIKEIGLLGF